MKTIIWSLFDSETAITQDLNSDKYKVYSIGLPSSSSITDNFIKIDLSKRSCLNKLSKLPKPDIIFASPPCETWVTVSVGQLQHYANRKYDERNLYWNHSFKGNDLTRRLRENRIQGQKTAYWTYRIIKEFDPGMWVIENGISSNIFKYLSNFFGLIGYKNICRYSSYCNIEFSEKPTIFYSNKKMKLRKYKTKSNIKIDKSKTKYSDRSKVPIQVYRDILNHYEGYGQQTLF